MDELPFAGHPVLGTAFVLAAPLQLPEIVLETGKGPIPVRLEREEGRISFGWMSQPCRGSSRSGPRTSFSRRSASKAPSSPVELYDNGVRHVYVALPSVEAVEALEPDLQALKRLQGSSGRTASRAKATAGRRGCSLPRTAFPRIRRPARQRAARLPPGPARAHLLRRGDRHLPRARRSGARARCTPGSRARRKIEGVEVGGSAVIVARGEFKLG